METVAAGPIDAGRLRSATIDAGLFWATRIPAPFFPGSAVLDPDNPVQPFTEWGVPVNQVTGAVLILPVLAGSYLLESRRMGRRAVRRAAQA